MFDAVIGGKRRRSNHSKARKRIKVKTEKLSVKDEPTETKMPSFSNGM